MPKKKPLEVSDWSQKYKLGMYATSVIVAGIGMLKVINLLQQIVDLLK